MTDYDRRFLDDFTNRVVDNAERFQKLDNRVTRIEKYLEKCDKRFPCNRCGGIGQRRSPGSWRLIGSKKTLYCEKCDKLFCNHHYCAHLKKFVRKINENKK